MLNTSAYAILGLLSIQPMTGYEMKKWVENGLSHFWKTSYGQIYPTLSKFLDEALVTYEKIENEKGPNSKLYTITSKGTDALKDWLKADVEDFNAKDESLLKFFFSGLLPIDMVIEKIENAVAFNKEIQVSYEKDLNKMAEKEKPTRQQLNSYLAVKKGVYLNEARVKWAEECIETLKWYKSLEE